MTLPVEIQLQIFGYVMASDAPVDLQEFVELGRELQSSREARSESDAEAESIVVEVPGLTTKTRQSSAKWAIWYPHYEFFTELHPAQREHYLDWLLINSTCRRLRDLGKVAFFSEKCFILRPRFLNLFSQGIAKNVSGADRTTALEQIRHVIAPLAFDRSARDFRNLPRYHVLQRMKLLTIQHRTYESFIRWVGMPVVEDLAAVDRIQAPQELLDFLRDLGLKVDRIRVDLIQDRNTDILQLLAVEVYPGLRKSAERGTGTWRRPDSRGPDPNFGFASQLGGWM